MSIVEQAANELFNNCSPLAAIADNAHGQEMTATCFQLRDINYYLRLISYSVIEYHSQLQIYDTTD